MARRRAACLARLGSAEQIGGQEHKGRENLSRPRCEDRLGLGRVDEDVLEAFVAFFLILISDFLTLDAVGRPGYRMQALDTDVFLAVQAHTERAFVDPVQGRAYVA